MKNMSAEEWVGTPFKKATKIEVSGPQVIGIVRY